VLGFFLDWICEAFFPLMACDKRPAEGGVWRLSVSKDPQGKNTASDQSRL